VKTAKTNAVRLLDRLGVRHELREYEVDPDDLAAETVASKVGLPPEQVFKTLVTRGDKHGVCLAVVFSAATTRCRRLWSEPITSPIHDQWSHCHPRQFPQELVIVDFLVRLPSAITTTVRTHVPFPITEWHRSHSVTGPPGCSSAAFLAAWISVWYSPRMALNHSPHRALL
jgi:hypothetical protein